MNANKRILLKVGGSLLFDSNLNIRKEIVDKFAAILQKSSNIIGVVIGGGKLARTYINAARNLDANEALCDTFGIGISRLNAKLLITALGDKAFPEPIENHEQARINALWNKILVAGGFMPGQSTTSVSFELAETLQATDVVILTDVDGIYSEDPHKNPDAIKFDQITLSKLEDVIYRAGESQSAAGEYRIFDAVSFQIVKRTKLNVLLVNGENFSDLEKLLIYEEFDKGIGTHIIRDSE